MVLPGWATSAGFEADREADFSMLRTGAPLFTAFFAASGFAVSTFGFAATFGSICGGFKAAVLAADIFEGALAGGFSATPKLASGNTLESAAEAAACAGVAGVACLLAGAFTMGFLCTSACGRAWLCWLGEFLGLCRLASAPAPFLESSPDPAVGVFVSARDCIDSADCCKLLKPNRWRIDTNISLTRFFMRFYAVSDRLPQTRHCSRPCMKISLGKSMPINTILLTFCSPLAQAGPRSLPINWWTP